MKKLTVKENALLTQVNKGMDNPGTGFYHEFVANSGLTEKGAKGVLASLKKKGLVESTVVAEPGQPEFTEVTITEAGVAAVEAYLAKNLKEAKKDEVKEEPKPEPKKEAPKAKTVRKPQAGPFSARVGSRMAAINQAIIDQGEATAAEIAKITGEDPTLVSSQLCYVVAKNVGLTKEKTEIEVNGKKRKVMVFRYTPSDDEVASKAQGRETVEA